MRNYKTFFRLITCMMFMLLIVTIIKRLCYSKHRVNLISNRVIVECTPVRMSENVFNEKLHERENVLYCIDKEGKLLILKLPESKFLKKFKQDKPVVMNKMRSFSTIKHITKDFETFYIVIRV